MASVVFITILYFLFFSYINSLKSNNIPEKRLCADPNCQSLISHAIGLYQNRVKYDGIMLPFEKNDKILIFSKGLGKSKMLWGGEVNGKFGYFQNYLVKETEVFVKNLEFEVLTAEISNSDTSTSDKNNAKKYNGNEKDSKSDIAFLTEAKENFDKINNNIHSDPTELFDEKDPTELNEEKDPTDLGTEKQIYDPTDIQENNKIVNNGVWSSLFSIFSVADGAEINKDEADIDDKNIKKLNSILNVEYDEANIKREVEDTKPEENRLVKNVENESHKKIPIQDNLKNTIDELHFDDNAGDNNSENPAKNLNDIKDANPVNVINDNSAAPNDILIINDSKITHEREAINIVDKIKQDNDLIQNSQNIKESNNNIEEDIDKTQKAEFSQPGDEMINKDEFGENDSNGHNLDHKINEEKIEYKNDNFENENNLDKTLENKEKSSKIKLNENVVEKKVTADPVINLQDFKTSNDHLNTIEPNNIGDSKNNELRNSNFETEAKEFYANEKDNEDDKIDSLPRKSDTIVEKNVSENSVKPITEDSNEKINSNFETEPKEFYADDKEEDITDSLPKKSNLESDTIVDKHISENSVKPIAEENVSTMTNEPISLPQQEKFPSEETNNDDKNEPSVIKSEKNYFSEENISSGKTKDVNEAIVTKNTKELLDEENITPQITNNDVVTENPVELINQENIPPVEIEEKTPVTVNPLDLISDEKHSSEHSRDAETTTETINEYSTSKGLFSPDGNLTKKSILTNVDNFLLNIVKKFPPHLRIIFESEPIGLSTERTFLLTIVSTFICFIYTSWMFFCNHISKKKLPDPHAAARELEHDLHVALREKEFLEEELYRTKNDIRSIRSNLSNNDIDRLKDQLKRVENEKSQIDVICFGLREKIGEMSNEIAEKNQDHIKIEEENLVLVQQVNALREHLTSIEKQLEDTTAGFTTNNEKTESLEIQVQQMTEEICVLQQSKDEAILEIGNCKSKSDEYKCQILELEAKINELQEIIEFKDHEASLLKDCIVSLKNIEDNDNDSDDNEEEVNQNSEEKRLQLEKMMDVARANADLKLIKEENEKLKKNCDEEVASRYEMQLELEKIRKEYKNIEIENRRAKRESEKSLEKLNILSEYFKEKETKLQREIGEREVLRTQTSSMLTKENEEHQLAIKQLEVYKQQVEDLKIEINETEQELRKQLSVQEKKAHENWLAARRAERCEKEVKAEAAILRQRLLEYESQNNDSHVSHIIKPLPTKVTSDGLPILFPPPPPMPPLISMYNLDNRPSSNNSLRDEFRQSPGSAAKSPKLFTDLPPMTQFNDMTKSLYNRNGDVPIYKRSPSPPYHQRNVREEYMRGPKTSSPRDSHPSNIRR